MMGNDTVSRMKIDINIVIGRQIMQLRKSRGLSGQALAKKLGISQQQISRYERGVCKIYIDNLIILLMHLEVSLDVFLKKVLQSFKDNEPCSYGFYCSVFNLDELFDNDESYRLIKSNISSSYFR